MVPLLLLLRFSCPSQLGEGVLDSLRGVTQALPTCGPDSCTQFSGDTGLHGCGVPCLAIVAVSLSLVHQGVPSYLNQLIEPTAGKGAWGPNDGTAAGLEEPRRNLGLAGLSPPEPPLSTLDRARTTRTQGVSGVVNLRRSAAQRE